MTLLELRRNHPDYTFELREIRKKEGKKSYRKYGVVDKVLEDIKTSIENEKISSDDKEEAIALVDDISEKVQKKKSPKVLKAAFKTLTES